MAKLGLAAVGVVAVLGASGAQAVTLTTSYATWAAQAPGAVETTVTGQFTPLDPLATVSTVALPSGAVGLSDAATTVERAAPAVNGAFPFHFTTASSPAGFFGDLFVPSGSSVTLTPPASTSALGFTVGTGGSSIAGPFTITVTLSNGSTASQSSSGGSFSTGATPGEFFGFYGGPIASLTISDADPAGFAFGDFYSVPEPNAARLLTAGLLAAGLLGLVGCRRRA